MAAPMAARGWCALLQKHCPEEYGYVGPEKCTSCCRNFWEKQNLVAKDHAGLIAALFESLGFQKGAWVCQVLMQANGPWGKIQGERQQLSEVENRHAGWQLHLSLSCIQVKVTERTSYGYGFCPRPACLLD